MISVCLFIAVLAVPPQTPAGFMPAAFDGSRCMLAQSAEAGPVTSAPTSRPSLRNDPRAVRWRKTIFWSTVLIFILIVAAIAIIRFSRRYAAYLKDDPAPPTASDDVWAMHRLPPDAPADDADDSDAEEEDSDDETDEPPKPGV